MRARTCTSKRRSRTALPKVRRCRRAARRHGRIVQTGLTHRSGEHFQAAVSLVKSGEIGNVKLARAWAVHRRKPIGRKPDAPAPEQVDYDRWLGPAAKRPFQPNRFHHNWQWVWDYGSGELGAWGVQLLDLARWGLGVGLPLRVAATGGVYYQNDDRQTPDTLSVQYSFPRASIVWEHRQWSNHGIEGAFGGSCILRRGRHTDRRSGRLENLRPSQRPLWRSERFKDAASAELYRLHQIAQHAHSGH